MAENLNDMNSMEFDVLKEIGNIGAGNATTALSQMLNTKIDMQVPTVRMLGFKELPEIIGGAENIVVGILLTLEGDIDGMMMFIMEKQPAHEISKLIMGGYASEENEEFSEMELSALKEIGNIIAGAYLNSLSVLTKMTISPSVPYLSIDMAGAILSVPAIEFSLMGDNALLIETQFGEQDKMNGYFILTPTVDSYSKILKSLGL
jgi:chemotaxis protein CheC